jgi:hypothetical protein
VLEVSRTEVGETDLPFAAVEERAREAHIGSSLSRLLILAPRRWWSESSSRSSSRFTPRTSGTSGVIARAVLIGIFAFFGLIVTSSGWAPARALVPAMLDGENPWFPSLGLVAHRGTPGAHPSAHHLTLLVAVIVTVVKPVVSLAAHQLHPSCGG